jgi:hypothetical protein
LTQVLGIHPVKASRAGILIETLTVSRAAPIVDTQTSVQQSVIGREVLDTVPTGRNVFAVGALIPGTSTNTQTSVQQSRTTCWAMAKLQ